MKYLIEFTKANGEVIHEENHHSEIAADRHLDNLYENYPYKKEYKNLILNLSEYDNSGSIGKVRLVLVKDNGDRIIRREFYRHA